MKSNCTTRCSSFASTLKSSLGSPCAAIAWDTRTRASHRVSSAGAATISKSLSTVSHHRSRSQNLTHRMPDRGQTIRSFHQCDSDLTFGHFRHCFPLLLSRSNELSALRRAPCFVLPLAAMFTLLVKLRLCYGCLMGVEPLPNIRDGILVERLVKTMRYVPDMRRREYVVEGPEGVRRRQRLDVEYVDRRARDLLVFQHSAQRLLFDDRPARRIDQPRPYQGLLSCYMHSIMVIRKSSVPASRLGE